MSMIRILIVTAALLLAAGAACAEVRIVPQDSGVKVRLRGISAVSQDVAWASGREGTVLRTVDGGKHWQAIKVPDAGELDFRDVEGFDADTAVVLSIGPGEASRVYRTEDGGKSWKLALQNKDPRAFFDCMVFEGDKGWMLGDPVDGRYQIRETTDAGRTWTLWENGPQAKKDEAAFAASGTCIARANYGQLVIVGGGSDSRAQLFRGQEWTAYDVPMLHRVPAAGIFSAASTGGVVVMVGGDFENDTQGSAAWIGVGAHGNNIRPLPPPRGYRSGVACSRVCIAVGPTGVDTTPQPIKKIEPWQAVSDIGYDAIDLAGDTGWVSGDAGRMARIEITH